MALNVAEPVLVTGGTGIVGANLIHRLVADGVRPAVLVRANSDRLRLDPVAGRYDVVVADLTDAASVVAAIQKVKPRTVFHLATSFFNPPTLTAAEHFAANLGGILNLLEAVKSSPCRFVWTGTVMACGGGERVDEQAVLRPVNVYGASKAAASVAAGTYARVHGVESVEVRLFTPYGPWERKGRLVPATILSALRGEPMRMSKGEQQRDFLYMDDAVEALLLAAAKPVAAGSIYNICSDAPLRVIDMVRAILGRMGDPITVDAGALPTRADEIHVVSGNNAAAARDLGWRPRTDLTTGLDKTIRWYRDNTDLALRLP